MPRHIRIASQAGSLLASGGLLKKVDSIAIWQIGLALLLAAAAIAWMYLHET